MYKSAYIIVFSLLISLSAWVEAATVRDNFTTASYARQDGSLNWSNGWQDSQGDGPSSGRLRVVTSGGGRMRLRPSGSLTMSRSVDTSSAVGGIATLNFNLTTSGNLDDPDQINVQIASSSAGPFTTLASYNNDVTVNGSFDVSAFISSDTTVRYTFPSNGSGGEFFYFDFIQIEFNPPVAPTINKAFIPTSIDAGNTSILRFTLDNSNSTALTGVNFTDNMPAAITLSNSTVGGTCTGVAVDGGTTAGSNNIVVTNGSIPANNSCTIEFTVTSSSVGTHSNTTSVVSTNEAPDSAVSNTASLTVNTPPPVGQGCGLLTINESFEVPDILNTPPTPFQTFTPSIKAYNNADVPGWATTSTRFPYIEIWHNNNTQSGRPDAVDGVQFVELNAYEPAALFQDVDTVPGQRIRYTFSHRGRNGTDTMRFLAGPPGAVVQIGPNYSTSNAAWATYTGTYTVPVGQTTTRFQYEAIGSGSVGNFLDDIRFVVECDFGDAPDTYSTLEASNGARHTVTPNLYFGTAPPDDDFPLYADGTGFVGDGQDDDNSGLDDEVTILPEAYEGVKNYTIPVTITNITGSTANIFAWVDFDRNGIFDDDEAASATVATGTTNGTVNLSWAGLGDTGADVNPGQSYLRLRASTNPMTTASDVGPLNDGEVEDHPLTIQNALNPAAAKVFTPAVIRAGETTTMTITLTNPHQFSLTGVSITDNMPRTLWLDSLTIGGTCIGFSLSSGGLGSSSLTLSGGSIPANSSCTLELSIMSSVTGVHDNTTTGYSSNELLTGPPSNTAQLTVNDRLSAVCTPANLGTGAVLASLNNEIYSINLTTAKAEFITSRAFEINGLAVNPEQYVAYYNDNTASNGTIYGYDLLTDTHFTVVSDVTALGVVLAGVGLNSSGAAYNNGAVYQGVEDEDDVWRIVLSADGRSARYATRLFDLGASHDFGDIVVTGDKLYDFDRGAPNAFRRYSLEDFSLEATVNQVVAQGGAQRDGDTLWSVGDAIQVIDANGVYQGTPVTITTDGSTPWGAALDSGNCVVTTSRIGDVIWNDEDGDGVKDTNEVGIAGVTVELRYDLNSNGVVDANDVVALTVTTAADGSYFFENLTPDDYIIQVTDTANILGGGGGTPPPPTNSGGSNIQSEVNVGLNEERLDVDFGYQAFVVVRGTVFEDNGAGVGTANNGTRDGSEAGFEGVRVELRNPGAGDALITSVQTDVNGDYRLVFPNSFAGAPLDIVVTTLNSYVSISENVGTTAASNTDTRDDRIRFTPTAGTVYSGVDFGDVAENTFTPNNTGTVQAGQVVFYQHEYVAGTVGELQITSSGLATPSGLTWQHILYNDVDCSGDLSSAESSAPLAASITTTAGQRICIINKVFAPTNAPFSAQYVATLTADFTYTGETPDGFTSQHVLNDLTTLAAVGLVLNKTVENLDAGTGAQTSNTATPNQRLRYTVTYTNNSTESINDLVIRDTVPAYTALDTPALCPAPLPNNLTACTVTVPIPSNNLTGYQGPIEWTFTGSLAAGQQGSLSFDVRVE